MTTGDNPGWLYLSPDRYKVQEACYDTELDYGSFSQDVSVSVQCYNKAVTLMQDCIHSSQSSFPSVLQKDFSQNLLPREHKHPLNDVSQRTSLQFS
jgi:hypothetical protein